MAMFYYGMCHSFIYPGKVTAGDGEDDTFSFYLNPELSYRVIIHDPRFYHIVSNSLVFPRIWLEFESEKLLRSGHYQDCGITLTQHHLLNRPEQPCEEEEDYNFLECVKTSQARSVGCRPPWDIWSPHTIPLCQTLDQLYMYEKIDYKYVSLERKRIVQSTGCKVPCKYKVCQFNYSDS